MPGPGLASPFVLIFLSLCVKSGGKNKIKFRRTISPEWTLSSLSSGDDIIRRFTALGGKQEAARAGALS